MCSLCDFITQSNYLLAVLWVFCCFVLIRRKFSMWVSKPDWSFLILLLINHCSLKNHLPLFTITIIVDDNLVIIIIIRRISLRSLVVCFSLQMIYVIISQSLIQVNRFISHHLNNGKSFLYSPLLLLPPHSLCKSTIDSIDVLLSQSHFYYYL